jgi:hypothetical protein
MTATGLADEFSMERKKTKLNKYSATEHDEKGSTTEETAKDSAQQKQLMLTFIAI